MFKERIRNELEQNAFDKFIISSVQQSTTTDQEKYKKFKLYCKTIRSMIKNINVPEVARERYNQNKLKSLKQKKR